MEGIMCDKDTLQDIEEFERRTKLTRRTFGAVAAGAGLAMLLPRAADAMDVTGADVNVTTPDGTADCYFVHPASGKHPSVLIWPDVFGLRPAFKQMGKRLAESGYSVLVVNPYYRKMKAPILPEGASFQDPKTREVVMPLMQAFTPAGEMSDAKAFAAWLDSQPSVDTSKKMGTTGYCMGGPFVFRTAAALPDRVGGAATFHGAALVADGPDSPHLLIPKTKARFLIAIAESDDMRQPEAKTVLKDGFAKAGLKAEVEVYKGTMHGWCPPDSQVYDKEQAERAWSRLLATFKDALV
jgi:carboxymethylenebutenolidase